MKLAYARVLSTEILIYLVWGGSVKLRTEIMLFFCQDEQQQKAEVTDNSNRHKTNKKSSTYNAYQNVTQKLDMILITQWHKYEKSLTLMISTFFFK